MSFTSKTWLELDTIRILGALDYRTVAIDLPGFGQSSKGSSSLNGSKFLHILIEKLSLKKPVIVSPSYSGHYSLPYLMEFWREMAGYVSVSPVGDQLITNNMCLNSNTGSADTKTSIDHISQMPEKLKTYLKGPVPNLDCLKVYSANIYSILL
jgi:pimeloyl-ACP methyl ester carboxylesterase